MNRKVIIAPQILQAFPDFKRGIIIVDDIKIIKKNKRIKKPLNKEIEKIVLNPVDFDQHPYIQVWEETHLKFGSNPKQYPPSIKALIARAHQGGGLPAINSVVTLFNYISLKYLLPCGGDDLNQIEGHLCLDFATGQELFAGLGSDELENPEPGEVIYYDDQSRQVMCRRWNWRNAEFSKITMDTKKVVINIDGIGHIPETIVIKARDELADLLKEHCQADLRKDLLNKDHRISELTT